MGQKKLSRHKKIYIIIDTYNSNLRAVANTCPAELGDRPAGQFGRVRWPKVVKIELDIEL